MTGPQMINTELQKSRLSPSEGELKLDIAEPVAPSPPTFTLWVRNPNPDEPYLIALLMRVCREHPREVPPEFSAYVNGDKSRQLSYRTSPNTNKGGVDVTWTLKG